MHLLMNTGIHDCLSLEETTGQFHRITLFQIDYRQQ